MGVPVWTDSVSVIPTALLVRGFTVRGTIDLRAKPGAYILTKLGRNGTTALSGGANTAAAHVIARRVVLPVSGSDPPTTVGGEHPLDIDLLGTATAASGTTVNADSATTLPLINVASISGFAGEDLVCIQDAKAAVLAAFQDDGGSFTDYTTAANSAGASDVIFWPAVPAVNDAFYIGSATTFMGVEVNVGTANVAASMTVVWEYWNGSTWTTLTTCGGHQNSISDQGVNGLLPAATGTKFLGFAVPSDWATTTVNSQSAYWVRARVSAFTSLTTVTLGTQLWTYGVARIEWTDLSKTAGAILTARCNLTFAHTSAQADTVRNKADVFGRIFLDSGSFYEVIVDYGDETAGEPLTVQVRAQSWDSY